MARDVGIEPTSRGLEALVLPLDESRIVEINLQPPYGNLNPGFLLDR